MHTPLELADHPFVLAGEAVEELDKKAQKHVVGEKEKKIISDVFQKFTSAQINRDRTFQYLDGRSLTQYISDCVGRFVTNFDNRDGIEDWQARVNVPMTHNKVIAVLGKIVAMLPMAEVNPRFDDDTKKAQILSELYEYSEDIDNYEELMICAALEAIVKGTVIGYEGYEYKTKKIRNITGYDKENNPQFTETINTESCLYGSIVPLEEFYPSSVSVRRIEEMPYAFRRYVIPYSTFVQDYSCYYPRWELVQAKASAVTEAGVPTQTFYTNDLISIDVQDGNVEIICYYNKDTDEYVMMANGVWLNPLKDFSVAPNPFNHKRLPFWSARFDTLGSDFFYGKSLVDRMAAMQDVLNVLTNMLLDQSFLTIFPPILTAGIDPIEEDYLRPGRRVPVDTQGLPLNQSFMKLDLGTPGGWHQFILDYTKRIMEESSVDQVSSGTAGVGGRTTAKEIQAASAGVAAVLGVFGKLLNYGVKNKAFLKCSNILQFWTDPKTPIASNILGDKAGIFADAFNVVSVDNARLGGGKRGKKIIAMYPSTKEFPEQSALKTRAALYEHQTGTPVEILAITGDYLRGLMHDIKLVPNIKSADTKEIRQALALEKAKVYLEIAPEMINKKELISGIAEAFGDDPEKIFQEAAPTAEPQMPPQYQEQSRGGVGANMIQQMMGGQEQIAR